ncbi:sigma-54-dependent transcriptional regulator [Heliobacterium mobile]|nr:sigma-54 dependent transcriptional regulator [Heliobacterium mobile]
MKGNLMVITPEDHMRWVLSRGLSRLGYSVLPAEGEEEAARQLTQHEVSLAVVDIDGPGAEGLPLLRSLQQVKPHLPLLVLTGDSSPQTALAALRMGAVDYLQKPFDLDELRITVEKALEYERVNREVEFLRLETALRQGDFHLIGSSPAMRSVREIVAQVADSKATVLVQGESGVGKEVVARALHHFSRRREKPFLLFPCASIPETMIETELFGWEKGSEEEGARVGRLELAHEGTICFQDVTHLSLQLQRRILQVLDEGAFLRVGGIKPVAIDVRVIVSSGDDLWQAVLAGRFREDLYYRLKVIPINLPPLRQRKEDILPLARHFLSRYDPRGRFQGFTADALAYLEAYHWPGNVRELANLIERAVILCQCDWISVKELALPSEIILQGKQKPEKEDERPLRLPVENRRRSDTKKQMRMEQTEDTFHGPSRVRRPERGARTSQARGGERAEPSTKLCSDKVVEPASLGEKSPVKDRSSRLEVFTINGEGFTITIRGQVYLDNLEKRVLEEVLQAFDGDQSETGRFLGLTRSSLAARLQKHHITTSMKKKGKI